MSVINCEKEQRNSPKFPCKLRHEGSPVRQKALLIYDASAAALLSPVWFDATLRAHPVGCITHGRMSQDAAPRRSENIGRRMVYYRHVDVLLHPATPALVYTFNRRSHDKIVHIPSACHRVSGWDSVADRDQGKP